MDAILYNKIDVEADKIYNALLGTYPQETLTDQSIASFSDGADGIPIKKLTAYIEPVQEGSGDPSHDNVRPISGHTECEVVRTGKNLWHKQLVDDTNVKIDGIITGKTYTASAKRKTAIDTYLQVRKIAVGSTSYVSVGYPIAATVESAVTFTVESGYEYYLCALNTSAANIENVQVEEGSSQTTYEPCPVYEITFPQASGTVYGGTFAVNQNGTGELVVDRVGVDLSTLSWSRLGTTVSRFQANLVGSKGSGDNTVAGNLLCENYKCDSWSQVTNIQNNIAIAINAAGGVIAVQDNFYDDASTFTTAMSGVLLVYELATPITYTLTAEEVITTLLGDNNVWHSCNGDLDITYRADLAKYITHDSIQNYIKFSGMIAGVETGLTASKAYNSGDYFIIGQKLYKATASIASGAAFTVGTNCTETTVGAELVTINS